MKILIITGDKHFKPGHPRFDLQAAQAELVAVYWGRGSLAPHIPPGPYDAVTVQDPFFRGLFALRAARRLNARFNVQLHTELSAQSLLKRTVARRVLRAADSVRVVSQRIKDSLEPLALRAAITVLPIYIDTSIYGSIVREAHDGKVILWVGRFEPEKDPLKMLSIFNDVRRVVPSARLVMLGAGSLAGALRAAAARLSLEGVVDLPGWQDPLPYLAQADVVVSTSRYEGFGASIIEALAAGVPVVAPDVGVAREAGATVASRSGLAQATIDALHQGARGHLRLDLPGKEAWAQAWAATLQ